MNWRVSNKQSARHSLAIGIDLGLKDLATLSNGRKLKADRYDRHYEQKLGIAQRARKKHRVNAAKNILALGHERLAGGIPSF